MIMDFFTDCPYVKLNKFLLTCFGLWPYQSKFSKYLNCIICVTWTSTASMALIQGLSEETSKDPVIFFESIATLVSIVGNLRQCISLHVKSKTIKRLFNRIERDWKTTNEPEEMTILKQLSQQGKLLIVIYMVIGVMGCAWFLSLAYLPLLLNKNIATDYSKIYPYYSHRWIVNMNLYKLQVILHTSFGVFFAGFISLTNISLYITSTVHICAIYRLKNLVNTSGDEEIIRQLLDIIVKHKETIESVHVLHKVFSNGLFAAQMFMLLSFPILIFDFNYQIDKSVISSSAILFIMTIILGYIFYINLGGQLIIEYSNRVFASTYFMHWYLLPKKAQKILLIIIMRSKKGDYLTNGLITLSLQNFTMIIKMSWSFAAVLLSIQRKKA